MTEHGQAPGGGSATAHTDPDIVLARAYLSRVAEPGSLAVAAFVDRYGPIDSARLIRSGAVPEEVRAATQARAAAADPTADLDAGAQHGVRLLVPESADWPHFAFAPLYRAQQVRLTGWGTGARAARYGGEPTVPLALWVAGPLPIADLAVRSVAVVGARAATAYGEQCAAEFGYGLAREDVTVVSGGAFGIDAATHRGALAAEGRSVLVSAGGLDRPYPPAHRNLFDRVHEQGLLVSESPPGAAPQRHRFLSRNRIIAALSTGTVVIEAAARSGALNTAAHCVLIGRPLMAVPGPITSAMSVGCHALLRQETDPARLVTSVADVLEVVGRVGEADLASSAAAAGRADDDLGPAARTYDDLGPALRAVLDGLPARRWVTEDQLAVLSGVPLPDVLRAIPSLRLAGLVESGPAGHRLHQPPRA